MVKTLTTTEAKKSFSGMLKTIQKPGAYFIITDKGEPKGVFVSFKEFEGLMETFDIMSDPKEVAAIRQAMHDKDEGDVVSYADFRKTLRL